MKNMRTMLVALICLFALLRTEGDVSLAAWGNNYIQMHDASVIYNAVIASKVTPYFKNTYPDQMRGLKTKWESHIFFCANKKGFDLEANRPQENGGFVSFSYDGTIYSHVSQSVLMVSKKNAETPPTLWNSNPLVFPAAILDKNNTADHPMDCLWQDVINPGFWTGMSKTFFSQNGGQSKSLPTGIEPYESSHNTMNKLWEKYVCNEIGEAPFEDHGQKRIFVFPKNAVLQVFDETGGLLKTDVLKITNIKVNDSEFEESKFTVAPASVKHIYDSDSKVWVALPK